MVTTSRRARPRPSDGFGFREATADWRKVIEHPDVDVVYVTAPNMMHEELAIASADAGKAVFCEKPVGGTPDQTVRVDTAARRAGVITGVGYNYRWAPLVQHAKQLIESGRLGEITNYRGRFFSMYGADPMGLLSWRFSIDEAGYGVSSDILSHTVDLATMLVGPITSVSGTMETFIRERPLPRAGGTHYDRGSPDDPTGPVTQLRTMRPPWCGSGTALAAPSNHRARSSAPNRRWRSTCTARRARCAGTSRR